MAHKKFYFVVGVLFVFSGFLIFQTSKLNAVEEPVSLLAALPKTIKVLKKVPLVHQSTSYSCGAAALQSALAYYGNELNEFDLQKELGTTQDGTHSEKLVEVAGNHGIKARQQYNSTIDDIRAHLKKKHLVIVEFQAWQDEGRKIPYKDDWDSGHYAVVIGIDKKNIYMMDPSILGGRGYLTIKDFEERWHDIDSKKTKQYQNAIFFEGDINPPPEWAPIE